MTNIIYKRIDIEMWQFVSGCWHLTGFYQGGPLYIL